MTDPAEEHADSHTRPESANPSRACPDYKNRNPRVAEQPLM
jgi:hypothetical protein